jgi:cell division protein FtsB
VSDWLRWRGREERGESDRDFTDARPVAERVRRQASDPEIRRRVKLRRRTVVLGLCGVCLAGSVVGIVGEGGYLDMRRLGREISELSADIERDRVEVERLEEHVRQLEEDPLARERVAREQLGLVLPGEVDFLLPKERPEAWEAAPAGTGPTGDGP